jgi:hypothetical protein
MPFSNLLLHIMRWVEKTKPIKVNWTGFPPVQLRSGQALRGNDSLELYNYPKRGRKEVDGRHNTHDVTRNTRLEIVIEVFGLAVVAVVNSFVFGVGVDADALDSLGLFRIAVDCDQDAVNFDVAGRYLERKRHLRPERLQDAFAAAAEYRIVGAGHADIGDISSALGQNPLIGGHDMGMRSETEARPAVEMVAHGDFLAGCLGVKIDDYDLGILFDLRQDSVGRLVGTVTGLHKKPPYQSDDCDGRAFWSLVEGNTFAGRLFGEIGRADYIVRIFQRRHDFSFAVGMVPQGNQVYAVPQQFIVDLPRQAGAAGGIFRVGYNAINAMLFDNKLELVGHNPPARPADDVTYTENV